MTRPTAPILRLAASRGVEDFRQSFQRGQDLFNYFGLSTLFLLMGLFLEMRRPSGGTAMAGAEFLGGLPGFVIAMNGIVTVAQVLAAERADGTIGRMRTVPYGVISYAVSKMVHITLMTMIGVALLVVPSAVLIEGFELTALSTIGLLAMVVLGLLSTTPIGIVLGSLVRSPRAVTGVLMIPIMIVSVLSGVFVPLEELPPWSTSVAMIFPVYWTCLGTREIVTYGHLSAGDVMMSGPWLWIVVVLVAWSWVGFAAVPRALSRVGRRAFAG